MHHKATLTIGTAVGRPYHIQCSCNSAGDFAKEHMAVDWFNRHTSRLGPTETSELHVPGAKKPAAKSPAPAPKQEAPKK